MNAFKNILLWIVKIAVGAGSFLIIYMKLRNDFGPEKISFVIKSMDSLPALMLISLAGVLFPLNWGIESYKWQQICRPLEEISLKRAMKSVYAGVFAGNFAPGRATEFVAKILFFQKEHRATAALLHFAGGLFQLSITLLAGIFGLLIKFNSGPILGFSYLMLIIALTIVAFSTFYFLIVRFDKIQFWVEKRFQKIIPDGHIPYRFDSGMVLGLLFWSLLRYVVFTFQCILLLHLFYPAEMQVELFASVALYFLITSTLPMISFIEPMIRSAIALLVFQSLHINELAIVCMALLLWLINIVFPSIIGYGVLVFEKFELHFFKRK